MSEASVTARRVNRTLNLTCLCFGLAAIVASRFWFGPEWLGIGMVLVGLSFLIDGAFPGGSDFTPQHEAMLAAARIPSGRRAILLLDFGLGIPLVAIGLYLALTL